MKKGYTRSEGVDYEEAFSEVVIFSSICLLVVIVGLFGFRVVPCGCQDNNS